MGREQDQVWGTVGRSVSLRGVPGAHCSLEELRSGQSGQSLLPYLAQPVAEDCQRAR